LWGLEMPKRSLMLVAGLFALLVAGCGGSEEGGDTASEDGASPTPSASPTASQSPTGTQSFDQPLVSEKKTDKDKNKKDELDPKKAKKRNSVPGLLASTDPDERARQVQQAIRKGRTVADPFASLPPILSFKTPVVSAATDDGNDTKRSIPVLPPLPGGIELRPIPRIRSVPSNTIAGRPGGGSFNNGRPRGSNGGGNNSGGGNGGNNGSNGGSNGGYPNISRPSAPNIALRPPVAPGGDGTSRPVPVPQEPLKPLPPIPDPTLAKAVEVTGVVVIGGIPRAIVKAPNEPTSRYVTVGQRLSNGLILVKRIEVNSGSDPVVILEQSGVEVSRAVGDKPAAPGGPGQPPVPPSA
jgi:hypothetical protein